MIYSPAAMFYVLRFGAPKVVLDFAYPSLQSVCWSRKALIQRNYIWLGSAILHLYIIFVIYIYIASMGNHCNVTIVNLQSSVFVTCDSCRPNWRPIDDRRAPVFLRTPHAVHLENLARLRHLPGWKDILIVLPLPRPLSVSEPLEDFCPKIFKAVFRNQTEQTRQDIKWIFGVRYHISSYSPLPYWI